MCFYAGGNTPHYWTLAEVERYTVQYRLPIFVRSNPSVADPSVDAFTFADVLKRVYGAPSGILVALDSETSIDAAYVHDFVVAMNNFGHPVIDYGSRPDVFGNLNPDGYYWAADWTGSPHPVLGAQGVQYRSLFAYDQSTMEPTLPFWDLRPSQPPPPKETPGMIAGYLLPGGTNSVPLPAPLPGRLTLFLDELPGTVYPVTVRVAMRDGNGPDFHVETVMIENSQNHDITLPTGCTAVSMIQQPGTNRNEVGFVIF